MTINITDVTVHPVSVVLLYNTIYYLYRMLLWHGSRLTNWVGILSKGLRIAPPEAPVTGYMVSRQEHSILCFFTKVTSEISQNFSNIQSSDKVLSCFWI